MANINAAHLRSSHLPPVAHTTYSAFKKTLRGWSKGKGRKQKVA
jgi:hypothetical protein